jgi:hypothetical protein
VIRSPVAQHVGYQGVGSGEYPGSLLGVIAMQRQMLYDAKRYGVIDERWRANPRGVPRPERDPRLEALVPAARGAEPVWIDARNENEIRRARRLAQELGLNLTVAGATEGWRALDALRGAGVVVSLDFPRPTEVTGWRFRTGLQHSPDDSAAADAAARKLVERNAAAIHGAGIRFALSSGGRPSELIANARKVIAAGLPAAVALEALTIRAAELAGVGEALGSIETGKIANLVVSTGPLLGDSSRITTIFVDGERYTLETEGRKDGTTDRPTGSTVSTVPTVAVTGSWAITANSPQGAMESTLTLQQQGAAFTGTMSSQMLGSTPVADGVIAGKRVTWSVTVTFGGQGFTINYTGEVEGTKMTGTVTAGSFGSFPFTGEKKP